MENDTENGITEKEDAFELELWNLDGDDVDAASDADLITLDDEEDEDTPPSASGFAGGAEVSKPETDDLAAEAGFVERRKEKKRRILWGKKTTPRSDRKAKDTIPAETKEAPDAEALTPVAEGVIPAPQITDTSDDANEVTVDELPIINGVRVERRKKPRVKKDPEEDLIHPDYALTLTKGMTNEPVRRIYLPHAKAVVLSSLGFVLGVALLCFVIFSVIYITGTRRSREVQAQQIADLTAENEALTEDNAELKSRVSQLSVSVNRNLEDRRAEEAAYEASLFPNGFPLSHYAEMEILREDDIGVMVRTEEDPEADEDDKDDDKDTDRDDASAEDDEDDEDGDAADDDIRDTPRDHGDYIAVFDAEEGSHVVAAATGVVTRIASDDKFGNLLTIDHRNGYTTTYRTNADAMVSVGDNVTRGDKLFLIGENNPFLGYQIRLNGSGINPSEMIELSG